MRRILVGLAALDPPYTHAVRDSPGFMHVHLVQRCVWCEMVANGKTRRSLLGDFAFAAIIVVLVAAIAAILFLPRSTNCPGRREVCTYNLSMIEVALEQYRRTHGRFPPAIVSDKNGRPMHSWRVLILPFLDNGALLDKYDLREPWDGPSNKKLAKYRPSVYVCPSDPAAQESPTMASYLAVVGPGTAWSEHSDRSDLSSDGEKRILLAEVADSGINWMEPRDLTRDEVLRGINRSGGRGISSPHVDGANVTFTNGHVEFLPSSTSSQSLRELLTGKGPR